MTEQAVFVYAFVAMTAITVMGIAEIQDREAVAAKAKVIAMSWVISLSCMVFAPYHSSLFMLATAFTSTGALAYLAIVYAPAYELKAALVFACSVIGQLVLVDFTDGSVILKSVASVVPLLWILALYGRVAPIVSTTANGFFNAVNVGQKAIF